MCNKLLGLQNLHLVHCDAGRADAITESLRRSLRARDHRVLVLDLDRWIIGAHGGNEVMHTQ